MKPIQRKLLLTFAFLIAAVAAVFGTYLLSDWRAGYAFEHIHLGDTKVQAQQYLGSPTRYEPCGNQLWWETRSLGNNDGRCVQQARYQYLHSAWIIGYSADLHVVSKYHEVTR
ncbi:MAG: hypothetical protein ACRESS_07165 [Stenotrophobium sp.]